MFFNPFVLPIIGTVIIMVYLAGSAWRRRANLAVRFFVYLVGAGAFYSLFYALEISTVSLAGKLIFMRLQYLGIVLIPVFLLLFTLSYTGKRITRFTQIILFIIPALTLISVWTNHLHQLYYQELELINEIFPALKFVPGSMYWFYFTYAFAMMMVCLLLLGAMWLRVSPLYRTQVSLLLIGLVLPWVALFLYIFRKIPWGVDPHPFTFTISGFLFYLGISRYRLFDLFPIRQATLFDNLADGVIVVDKQQRFIECNKAAARYLGIAVEDMGRAATKLFCLFPELAKVTTESKGALEVKCTLLGKEFWFEITYSPLVDANGNLQGQMIVLHNVTKQKQAEIALYREKLHVEYLSYHDQLTGLYNRRYFEAELARLDVERQLPLSIIMVDANGLKLVNDAFGHQLGDEFLKETARLLRQSCRAEDVVARWGGDEFIILLPQTDAVQAKDFCQRLKGVFQTAKGDPIPYSISLGAATKTDPTQPIRTILKQAEDTMYHHKVEESTQVQQLIMQKILVTLREKCGETQELAKHGEFYALKMAKALGLSEQEQEKLALLVALHDLGKIVLPETILQKERLTEEEWAIKKKHPEIGFRIARYSGEFGHIADEILAHHEHWDGSGYPKGLRGEEIPLISRIAAIIDYYNVAISGRPNRKAITKTEAIRELQKEAGTRFDPVLVQTFLKILEEEESPLGS